MPLLWYLRDVLRLTGTKYGSEHGENGADLVLVNGKAVSAITRPMKDLADAQVTTVEGLAGNDGSLHPVQQAFIDEDAIGCGYCTPGWLIASIDLLRRKPHAGDGDIDQLPNLCRCGCQTRVRRAIKRVAGAKAAQRMSRHTRIARRPAPVTSPLPAGAGGRRRRAGGRHPHSRCCRFSVAAGAAGRRFS